MSVVRYLWATATRTRAPLAPAAGALFAVVGTFASSRNEVGGSWALTALFGCGLSAWLVGAILAGEPPAQADMATAAMGGQGGRDRADVVLVAAVALTITALFIIYPLALGVAVPHVFDRTPDGADLLAAALAHLTCCAFGGAIGVAFSPPRVIRRATAVAATLGALLLAVAVGGALGPFGGPGAVAQRLSDAPPRAIDGAEVAALAVCIGLAALLLTAAAAWTRRRA